jgi:hypothetical protein
MLQRATILMLVLSALVGGFASASAQDAQTGPIRVFLECGPCDFDFQRTEIAYVSWMRDRADADVHILWRSQPTGGGGQRHSLDFIGLQGFAGKADTLVWVQGRDDTSDAVRRGLNRIIEMGLMRYVATTDQASQISISVPTVNSAAGAAAAAAAAPPRDPWDFWVFSVNANGNTNGESTSDNLNINANLSANRTTADWKINLSAGGNYGKQTFTLSNGSKTESTRSGKNVNGMIVKSVNGHTSMGATMGWSQSTFGNTDNSLSISPAIEYNVFPYTESTRRQLLVTYSAGVRSQKYREETIYSQIEETRPTHSLSTSYSTRQNWGNVNFGASGSQYLHDTSKYNVNFFSNFSVNITRGLRVNMSGNYSMIRDQLNIAKRNLTDEEILLRQQAVATSFRYFMSAGLSYRFGSSVQNVVNPRFGGGGGGEIIFF